MTNSDIIIRESIANGIFTQEQIDEYVSAGQLPPIHTYATWKRNGFRVRKGEHARLVTCLWKLSGKNEPAVNGLDEAPDRHYYLAKAFLFTSDQVERDMEVAE